MFALKYIRSGLILPCTKNQSSSMFRNFRRGFATEAEFKSASENVQKLTNAPDNNALLKLYALFKQASVGKCDAPKPGMMDFVKKAKWTAWNELGDLSQEDARQRYVDFVKSLQAAEPAAGDTAAPSGDASVGADGLDVKNENGVCYIKLNRPKKRNAITLSMYEGLAKALNDVSDEKTIKFVVISAEGDFFCAGNDLGNFQQMADQAGGDLSKAATVGAEVLEPFVAAFINCKKPIIGLVQGPAIGVSVTTMALYDTVYASDKAYFHTPFSSLGQSPEGCSSYLFPRMMGHAKANEFLMFEAKWSAETAQERGLVTQVFPDNSFAADTKRLIDRYAKLPPMSLSYSKQLVCSPQMRETLHHVNKEECKRLEERWQSQECINAIMAFMSKSKI